jgi:protein-S-isoprenylcysteine O-methyltransferase Ste14
MGVAFVFLPLAGYYAAPFLLISRSVIVPPPWVGLAVALFVLGIFLHYVSDAQKSFTLRIRKGLITDGLFARTRNPNYLGEFLIYLSLAILSQHWLPFAVLAGWGTSFVVRMRRKDRSLSRHEEFAAYRARTGLFLPHVGGNASATASAGQPAGPTADGAG